MPDPSVIKTPSLEPQEPEHKKMKPRGKQIHPVMAEVRKENKTLKSRIRVLEARVKTQNKKLQQSYGGGYIPGAKITEWREKCVQIISGLDELRDAMREVLQDVQTYPKNKKADTLTVRNNQ